MVAVYNGSDQPQTLTLRCALESDLDRTRALPDTALTLAAGERREVPVTWTNGAEEYGFALAATLVDAAGKPVSQGREYFSVADNLWKVGLTSIARGSFPPMGPGPNRSIPLAEVKSYENKLAADLAKPFAPVYWSYVNYMEYMGTTPDNYFDQAPSQDYWYGGMGDYTMGKRWMQMAIEWLHRRGARATSYVLPASCGYGGEPVYRKHPDWFSYGKNGELAGSLYEKKLEVGSAFPNGEGPWGLQLSGYGLWLGLNIARTEPIDAFVDQVIKAQKMFGWDGIRFDVAPYIADGYDFNGKPIVPGGDPKKRDELEVAAWKRMRDSIWKALGPNFVIGLNSDRDLYYDQYPAEWDECCRQGQLLMEEVPRSCTSPQSPRNRWYDYMTFYHGHGDIVRGLGGHHLVIGFDVQNPVDGLYLHAITYAMRAHPYGGYRSDELPLGNYSQFVTRYSALIWDIERVKPWAEAGQRLEVASAAPVWWKELACVRTTAEGKRQYIVQPAQPRPPMRESTRIRPTKCPRRRTTSPLR